jgi:hypothetical protein
MIEATPINANGILADASESPKIKYENAMR